MNIHDIALRDPVFRSKRRRWIRRWRRSHRGGCDWCMGHQLTVTLITPRADSKGSIALQLPDGVSIYIDSRHEQFWHLHSLHERLLRGER